MISRVGDTIQHSGEAKPGKRQQITYDYRFDHRHVCKDTFMFLHNIGTKQLKNLRKHLQDNSRVPRQQGLTGHTPATTYPYEITYDAVHFILLLC